MQATLAICLRPANPNRRRRERDGKRRLAATITRVRSNLQLCRERPPWNSRITRVSARCKFSDLYRLRAFFRNARNRPYTRITRILSDAPRCFMPALREFLLNASHASNLLSTSDSGPAPAELG